MTSEEIRSTLTKLKCMRWMKCSSATLQRHSDVPMYGYKEFWKEVLETVKVSVSPAIFKTWFSKTYLDELTKENQRYKEFW